MQLDNAWTGGFRDFHFPPLSADVLRPGCSLHRMSFDPDVGKEVFALFREDPPYAAAYEAVQPLTLIVHSGLVRTPAGIIAFIVWQIAPGTPHEVSIEQYLNPHEIGALRLVADAAAQTHFKLIIIDRSNSEVCSFVDFSNTFAFDELASAMVLAIGHEEPTDFAEAVSFAMARYRVTDLVTLSLVEG